MRTLLTLILIALIQRFSFGQDTTQIKFKIMILPSQFVVVDFPLTVERVFKRQTLGLTVSYRPSTQNSGEIHGGGGSLGAYLDQNFRNYIYNSITVGLNTKYFLSKRRNFFIDANIFYRYWWFDYKNCHYDNVEGYRFNATRTERQYVYGFKLLFGNTFQLKSKSKIKPIIELYCGLGLRYKTYVLETFNGTVYDIYYTYKKEIGSTWYSNDKLSLVGPLSIQGGIKVGIGM